MSNKENIEVVETTEEVESKQAPAKKGTSKKTQPKANVEKAVAQPKGKEEEPAIPPAKKKLVPVDRDELVEVRSCVYGELNYHAPSGNHIYWGTFDDPNWMSVNDLMEMRNSQRAFFEKNWIVLVGDNALAVMQYLQIDRYYKTITATEDFDEIFSYDPADIPAIIEKMSPSIKETVARRAYVLIENGELDSHAMIVALEDALGYDLRDPQ